MSDLPSNPYQPPKEGELFAGDLKPGAPPITPVRLAIGLVLIIVAWGAFWAQVNRLFGFGQIISILCYSWMWRTTDPHSQRGDGAFKWYHLGMLIISVILLLVMVWFRDELPLEVKSALKHPVAFFVGGGLSCWILLADWQARRNNPPYQPETQIELPASSPWQRFARFWNMR